MDKLEYKLNRFVSRMWLVVSIGAFVGAIGWGAWHQLLIAAIALFMYLVTKPPKMVHIEEGIYFNLDKAIDSIASDIEEGFAEAKVEEELSGGKYIRLDLELTAKKSKVKFTDEAWGAAQTFTETNWSCEIKVVGVHVFDEDGNIFPSDFEEGYLTLKYEFCDWK